MWDRVRLHVARFGPAILVGLVVFAVMWSTRQEANQAARPGERALRQTEINGRRIEANSSVIERSLRILERDHGLTTEERLAVIRILEASTNSRDRNGESSSRSAKPRPSPHNTPSRGPVPRPTSITPTASPGQAILKPILCSMIDHRRLQSIGIDCNSQTSVTCDLTGQFCPSKPVPATAVPPP